MPPVYHPPRRRQTDDSLTPRTTRTASPPAQLRDTRYEKRDTKHEIRPEKCTPHRSATGPPHRQVSGRSREQGPCATCDSQVAVVVGWCMSAAGAYQHACKGESRGVAPAGEVRYLRFAGTGHGGAVRFPKGVAPALRSCAGPPVRGLSPRALERPATRRRTPRALRGAPSATRKYPGKLT